MNNVTPPFGTPRRGRAARAEVYLRNTGASLLAACALVAVFFVPFALGYKTYNLVRLGKWYFWGAPTHIGIFNRLMSYTLTIALVLGIGMLASAAALRLHMRRQASGAHLAVQQNHR